MLFKGNSSRLQLLIEKIQSNNKDTNDEHDIEEALSGVGEVSTEEAASSWSSAVSEDHTSPDSCATTNSGPGSTVEHHHNNHNHHRHRPSSVYNTAAAAAAATAAAATANPNDANPYACQYCDKTFPRGSYLKKHEQTHGESMPFKCQFCRRLFKHKRSRDRHVKLHTGDKKYKCTQCDHAFSRSDHLKIHMKTHDNQKPFQCTVCNRGYSTAAALTSHMQNHHKRAAERANSPQITGPSYKCLQCTQIFRKPDELQNHTATHHLGEQLSSNSRSSKRSTPPKTPNQYICMYCTKEMPSMDALQQHFQTKHSAIVNGKSQEDVFSAIPSAAAAFPWLNFADSPALALPPYSCRLCMSQFPSVSSLQKHFTTAHYLNSVLNNNIQNTNNNNNNNGCKNVGMVPLFNWPTMTNGYHNNNNNNHHPPPAGVSAGASFLPEETVQTGPTDLSVSSSNKHNAGGGGGGKHNHSSSGKHKSADDPRNHGSSKRSRSSHGSELLAAQHVVDQRPIKQERCGYDGGKQQPQQPSVRPTGVAGLMGNKIQLPCPHCHLTFTHFEDYQQHVIGHFLMAAAEYSCQECSTSFSTSEHVQKHLMETHAQNFYRCMLCKEVFPTKAALKVHFSMNHGSENRMFRCNNCTGGSRPLFHTEIEFIDHLRNAHYSARSPPPVQTSLMLRCLVCHATFNSQSDMEQHLASHSKQFQCQFCSEAFHIEFLLDRHIQTHHSSAILSHLNRNHRESPNSICASPTYMSRLTDSGKHPTENGINACDICEKNDFRNELDLITHKRTQHQVKPTNLSTKVSLHCAYCNENCKSRTELENHMKTHSQHGSNVGKHKCNICDEIYQSAISLAEHKLTHCKVATSTVCSHCKMIIDNEDQFYQHLQKHCNPVNVNGSQVTFPTSCIICRQTLVSDIEVKVHVHYHLSRLKEPPAMCSNCNRYKSSPSSPCTGCNPVRNATERCPDCGMTFETFISLQHHLTNVHRKPFHCFKCKIGFELQQEATIHLGTHLATLNGCVDGIECGLCPCVLPTANSLQTHLIEHTFAGCKAFTCYLCSAIFTAPTGLQAHMSVDHSTETPPYDCPRPSCQAKFFFTAELDRHTLEHQGQDVLANMNFYKYQNKLMSICDKIPFKCTECYQSFLTQTDLQCHMYEHHHQMQRESSSVSENKEGVKQEEIVACIEPVNGDVAKDNEVDDAGDSEKPIKVENQHEQVTIKTEKHEKEHHDDDDDEELIDVGVNNRIEVKSRAENDVTATH
ncbi:Zinc finger C2H2-type,Zinc finger, RING/FYVE/PHD-type [Cinara cedri]|uniref:Zinc finger C2H2-type,Zinc finger, RING/FYVE/PHD-type n=1 Tax=Cinara cedri TaxID=506608 RepID=A0A5E4MQW1_9HEMI|nr:Zinc finger C2H2-type,Zinc finger, RING/FYVE/PHD-type [Cinara cedri]